MSLNKKLFTSAAGLTPSFGVVTYTGNGSTNAVTGLNFQPDFVWLKNRSQNFYAPRIFDSSRGATKRLQSSTTASESAEANSLTSFDTGGFTLGSDPYVNNSGDNFVAWCFKANGGTTSSNSDGTITSTVQANKKAGFSIVKYVGDGTSGATIGHGLSSAPEMVISKSLDSTNSWNVYHTSLTANYMVQLNTTNAQFDATAATKGGGITVDASNMTILSGASNQDNNNKSADNFIAYCWHSVPGYSAFGYWQGGTTTINIGFRPDFVLYQDFGAGGAWTLVDSVRGDDVKVLANTGDAESSQSLLTITDTGFTVTSESSIVKRLYMAFKIN